MSSSRVWSTRCINSVTSAGHGFAELDVPAGRNHLVRDLAPVFQRHPARIMALQKHKLEQHQIDVRRRPAQADDRLQCVESERPASLIIMASPSRMKLSASIAAASSGCPVEAVLRVEPDAVFVLDNLRSIAVKLVDPPVAYRRGVE